MKPIRSWPVALTVLVVLGACGRACTGEGDEGGPCFPNDTCNDGLTCLSELCVDAGEGEGHECGEE